MSQYLSQKRYSNFILHFENVVFGYFIQDNVNNKAFVINLFVLLVKFHIHRCKFSNRKPCFTVFYKELESYFCTIQRLSKLSVCVLSSKYLSNVKVMHVFKCIFILTYLNNTIIIIIFYFPGFILSVVLFCMCCSRHNKKKLRESAPADWAGCSRNALAALWCHAWQWRGVGAGSSRTNILTGIHCFKSAPIGFHSAAWSRTHVTCGVFTIGVFDLKQSCAEW